MLNDTSLSNSEQTETKEIPLTQGKVAIVDAADYEWLSSFKWHAHQPKPGLFYAQRNQPLGNGKYRMVRMHREILNAPNELDVDHIDGDGLNNTRRNIRVCSGIQNRRNSRGNRNTVSGYKGVNFDSRYNKWHARIEVNNKRIHLGYFSTPEDAARAYDVAALKYHGEFARLNLAEARHE